MTSNNKANKSPQLDKLGMKDVLPVLLGLWIMAGTVAAEIGYFAAIVALAIGRAEAVPWWLHMAGLGTILLPTGIACALWCADGVLTSAARAIAVIVVIALCALGGWLMFGI